MARYIDAEDFAKRLAIYVYMAEDEDFTKAFVKGMELVKKAENETPTADVILKHEVGALKLEMAKEIFAELDEIVRKRYNQHIFSEDLESEEKESVMDFEGDVSYDILKLKKKYLEGDTDE